MKYYLLLIAGLLCVLVHSFQLSYSDNNTSIDFDKLLASYWDFWSNVPRPIDDIVLNSKCYFHYDSANSLIFLVNPFSWSANYDCSNIAIPKNATIFFPIITGFCSNGDKFSDISSDQRKNDFFFLLDCAYSNDRGMITGIVKLDGKQIVNFKKENIFYDGSAADKLIDNPTGIIVDSGNYKELFTTKLVDLYVNGSGPYTFKVDSQNLQKHPAVYKNAIHCECVIIFPSQLENNSSHTIEYSMIAKANKGKTPGLGLLSPYDEEHEVEYKLVFK